MRRRRVVDMTERRLVQLMEQLTPEELKELECPDEVLTISDCMLVDAVMSVLAPEGSDDEASALAYEAAIDILAYLQDCQSEQVA